MADIFISYRRQDCPAAMGRLADRLLAEFGADRVFLDVGDIVPGADFVQTLERALASATVVLALVGPRWLQASGSDGRRRLDDPQDFVRREIELALAHGKPVIPVLLEGARMPQPQELPAALRAFASCQAVVLATDRWDTGWTDSLCKKVRLWLRPVAFKLFRVITYFSTQTESAQKHQPRFQPAVDRWRPPLPPSRVGTPLPAPRQRCPHLPIASLDATACRGG
ncbi:toll/interleukin-1 receptor domain-containing protein [Azohydromonas aeria]|uniref:toll/interleukin-1 receptor domain-containing protein n=1 Tax=Azohydromonas aeria TaxID=2590212 RepID=UPI0012FBE27C|nr:toll/interleukin-1 receptor domain-containing protein [Azohydromonas aeria]